MLWIGERRRKYPSQMNRTRMGLGCKGEYFIYVDNMDTLKNVFNFRCMIQNEKAKPFSEVKRSDNKSCLSSFLYHHGSVN